MVCYFRLFKNFPQFVVIHTIKSFSVVSEAEVDVFLEFSCFSYDPTDVSSLIYIYNYIFKSGFPGGSVVKNLPANTGVVGSILELGSFPGEGNGNLLQFSCLGNPMDRGAWWATVHGATRIRHDLVTKQPSPPQFNTG